MLQQSLGCSVRSVIVGSRFATPAAVSDRLVAAVVGGTRATAVAGRLRYGSRPLELRWRGQVPLASCVREPVLVFRRH